MNERARRELLYHAAEERLADAELWLSYCDEWMAQLGERSAPFRVLKRAGEVYADARLSVTHARVDVAQRAAAIGTTQ